MAAKPQEKCKVKIKSLTKIIYDGVESNPGDILEVNENDAKSFCDKEIIGHYSFSGERDIAAAERFKLKRAVRI
jgi:hypothetical protein